MRIRSLLLGISLPFAALRLILRSRKLLFWSALPIAITITLYGWAIGSLKDVMSGWIKAAFLAQGWDPSGFFAILAVIAAQLLLVLAGVLTFSVVASIAASPFNDLLAEAAEPLAKPPLPPVPPQGIALKIRLIVIDVLKSLAAAVAAIAALLLSWIPIVNFFAALLTFLLLAFQFISYPQTRRDEGLRDGIQFLRAHPFACIGFGAALAFLFAIPLLSALMLPLAVVGGTLLYARAKAPENAGFPPLR